MLWFSLRFGVANSSFILVLGLFALLAVVAPV
jgi:hypothetical protein